MPYKFLKDLAIADVAFEAEGKTLEELFESAALALTNTMIKDLGGIGNKTERRFSLSYDSLDMLLLNFLEKLIFYKDTEQLIFSRFEITINKNGTKFKLVCKASGEKIDINRHEQIVDVKAVTLHLFELKNADNGWRCRVVLDI